MKKKIQQGKRQRNRIRTRIILACAIASGILTVTGCMLVLMNMYDLSKIRAAGTGTEGGGSDLNNGEIISEFTWDKDPVTMSTLGPDAIRVSKEAHSMPGGKGSTNGLSPGSKGKDIDFQIEGIEIFNLDGIDISIDFRRNEPSGDFFSRGSNFNFGMDDGYLTISYCLENSLGKTVCVKEKTKYEIPADPVFRNYRFMYTPSTGKGEIFVNDIIIWQHVSQKNSALSWKGSDNITIGRGVNGGGLDRPVFDNLVVRTTGTVTPLAESLLHFILEPKDGTVKVRWSTSFKNEVDHFIIERSENGKDFTNIAKIDARKDTSDDDDYAFTDKTKTDAPLVYYRIRQSFKNGKVVAHALSAIKFKTDKGLSIERVNPSPFDGTYDISYFLPKTGRVWMQVTDSKGKVINTESFEAPQGKNVYVFKDRNVLESGTYTFSLIFESKKISKKIVKI